MTAAEEILEESAGDLAEALDPLGVFLARAGRCLSALAPAPGAPLANPQGDHSLDPNPDAVRPALPYRSAAVLVPVIARERGLHIVLTQRAAHLRDHSGQVAFPGGKIEPGDPDPAAAALREAGEEIGLSPDAVRVLGYLDPYLSATGFLVVPVVALVAEARASCPTQPRSPRCSRCRWISSSTPPATD